MNINKIANQCFAIEVQLNLKKIGMDEVHTLLEDYDAYFTYKSLNSVILVHEEPKSLSLEQRQNAANAISLSASGNWVQALHELRNAFLSTEEGDEREFTDTEFLYFHSVVRMMLFHFYSMF